MMMRPFCFLWIISRRNKRKDRDVLIMEYKFSQLFKWNSGKPITPTTGSIPVYGSNGIIGYTDKAKFNNKIILGRVGAYCGSVEYCRNDFNATDNTLITTCDETKIIYPFAYYLLRQYKLNEFAGGSAQPLITQGLLKHLKCNIPDIPTQKKIADILSTYDDLIENNNKRIKILEQMAENLYKEWFVRFRFPGHETTEFENGLPKGWKTKRFIEEFNITYGKGLPTEELLPKGYPVFGSNGLIGYYSKYMYEKPQVLISCRGASSGVVNISLPYSFITSNSLICEIDDRTETNFEYLSLISYLT
jgi:type I restriction enzyme S subunit